MPSPEKEGENYLCSGHDKINYVTQVTAVADLLLSLVLREDLEGKAVTAPTPAARDVFCIFSVRPLGLFSFAAATDHKLSCDLDWCTTGSPSSFEMNSVSKSKHRSLSVFLYSREVLMDLFTYKVLNTLPI